MTPSDPAVSIIVLNYNGKEFLGECLESLAAQTMADFELIVVDNGSTDGSVEYLRELASGSREPAWEREEPAIPRAVGAATSPVHWTSGQDENPPIPGGGLAERHPDRESRFDQDGNGGRERAGGLASWAHGFPSPTGAPEQTDLPARPGIPKLERLKLICNERNLGFAAGNNVALPEARGRFIVFLNNDTRVDPGWLDALLEAAERHPEAGSFASQIRSYDSPEILDTIGISIYRDGMSRGLGRLQPAERFAQEREVFAPSGCAAMFRREVLEQIGGFDGDFFAYCEDMDLGMRARLAGWSCWYVPEARVYHRYSGTAGKYSPFKAFLVERNHLWLLVKLFPKRLILQAPWYALVRYALQAWGVLTGRGASGKFASQFPAYKLVFILLRAYGETLLKLPELLRKRRDARRHVRVSRAEILSWFDRFGISAAELALQE